GSTYAMGLEAGAEGTMLENRFVPARFKDGYGPVGAWFLLFKAKAMNANGEDYQVKNAHLLEEHNYGNHAHGHVMGTCLRNHLMMEEMRNGEGPIIMDTPTALAKLAETMTPKEIKHLEAEAWEDFLDMTISQAILWAASNVRPEEKSSEIAAAEPYFIGSHSGASGAWVSGPEDLQTGDTKNEYFWGYANMSTVPGLFCAGDASGASSHKFSSGSLTEGRIAAKAAVKFIVDNNSMPNVGDAEIEALKKEILLPMDLYEQHKGDTTDPEINPNYIKPKMFMFRLQKIMDEYAGGVTAQFTTNQAQLEKAMELLAFLKEDSEKLAASNHHELMRCWENVHRMWQAEAHVRTMLFREETRWPGYYFRSDTPKIDEEKWKVFANCKWDPKSDNWEMISRPVRQIFA
ncbi:MAG: adenylyl-sulfate reductase subunit alpha, partial [Acidobacteriota bacterium]